MYGKNRIENGQNLLCNIMKLKNHLVHLQHGNVVLEVHPVERGVPQDPSDRADLAPPGLVGGEPGGGPEEVEVAGGDAVGSRQGPESWGMRKNLNL